MNPELEKRLHKTGRSLAFAVLLCRILAAAILCSPLVPLALGLMEGERLLLFFLFRPLPMALALFGLSLFLDRFFLAPFKMAAAAAGRTPGRPMSMRWTGKSAPGGYLAEFSGPDGRVGLRAGVQLDGRAGILWNWTKDALVFAASGAPGEPILAAAGDRLYFGRILGEGFTRPLWPKRLVAGAAIASALALIFFLERWYQSLPAG